MNYWVWSVTPENWEIVISKNIWAVSNELKTKKTSKGDFIVFYVKGSGTFKGSFKVDSDWYNSSDLIWPDEIKDKEIKYPFQCKLEPQTIGDSVFNELIPSLSFTKEKTIPQLSLRGTVSGPANNGQSITEADCSLIVSKMQEPAPKIEPSIRKISEHEEIISTLYEIGIALGFESHRDQDYTRVGRGSVLDLVWVAKVPNLVEIWYTFEVQSKGSIDSLINNLIQSMNNPTVRKVIAVSDQKQLDTIKTKVDQMKALPNSAQDMFIFLDIKDVNEFANILPNLTSFKESLHLS